MENVNKSFQNQLSIQISDCDDSFSSNDQSQCTPIKSQNSPSMSESSSAESSFSDESTGEKSQIEAQSTPQAVKRIPFNSTPLLYNSNQSLIKIVARKPAVNFHSIDDIVYGGSTNNHSNNDSGFSNSLYQTMNQSAYNQTKSNDLVSEEATDNNDDKENMRVKNDKKYRTTFSEEQKKLLDFYFAKNPYPDPRETEDMSQHLVLPENVIKVWFQNKRSRDKQRKFSRDNSSKASKQLNEQSINSSPLIANLQFLSNQINSMKAVAAFTALANNNFRHF